MCTSIVCVLSPHPFSCWFIWWKDNVLQWWPFKLSPANALVQCPYASKYCQRSSFSCNALQICTSFLIALFSRELSYKWRAKASNPLGWNTNFKRDETETEKCVPAEMGAGKVFGGGLCPQRPCHCNLGSASCLQVHPFATLPSFTHIPCQHSHFYICYLIDEAIALLLWIT